MTGFTDYTAKNIANYLTGQIPEPALPAVYLGLFTTLPTDANTGGTEVSGGSYTRVQVAGSVAATASFTTGSPNITMTSNPGWVTPGMTVYDTTNSQAIGTVSTYVGTALVLTANALHASSGSTDNLTFSAFGNATGSAPSTIANTAVVTFAAATANWGTVVGWGLFDALTSGNYLFGDFIGNYPWQPGFITSASPGVFDVHAHGFNVADSLMFSTEYGGTAPTFSQSNFTGILVVAHAATDTFDVTNGGTAVNTSSTGDGLVRKVAVQPINTGTTPSFPAASFNMSVA